MERVIQSAKVDAEMLESKNHAIKVLESSLNERDECLASKEIEMNSVKLELTALRGEMAMSM